MIQTYTTICRYNRQLYGRLEELSLQIKAYEGVDYVTHAKYLKERKRSVQRLIDINLARLEALWKRKRNAGRKRPRQRRANTKANVLCEWYKHPEMPEIKVIAYKQDLPLEMVCRIINAEINKVA